MINHIRSVCGVIIVIHLVCVVTVFGQRYQIRKYDVSDGLPSGIVKGCMQDSLGYFWMVTDEGLVKFDGLTFTSYRDAMKSNYAKGFLRTRNGKLLAFGDLDLIEIRNLGDTVIFKTLCPVSRVTSDSALTYPKLLYEDLNGDVWVSESQSVVRLHNGHLERYEFGLGDRTPRFLRSFSFFEDLKGNLYTCSFQGNVFRLSGYQGEFVKTFTKFPPDVEYVSVVNNQLLIGCSKGIYGAELLPDGGVGTVERKCDLLPVTYVAPLPGGRYFAATHAHSQFIIDGNTWKAEPLTAPINNVNHVYVSRENDICLSGDDGFSILHENLFEQVNDNVEEFIESITQDSKTGIIYYATSSRMFSFNPKTKASNLILDLPSGYFQSLIHTGDGIWAANAFKVMLLSEGKTLKEFDFSSKRLFVTMLTKGKEGRIWITLPGVPVVYMIDSTFVPRKFSVPLHKDGFINMVREGNDGVYVTSTGTEHYLFKMSIGDTTFTNISKPVPLKLQHEFNVTDFVLGYESVWLATSDGLYEFNDNQMRRVEFGSQVTTLPVKAIAPYGDKLLLANVYGLLLFDPTTNTYDVFNEGSGLPSNTITPKGIFVSRDRSLFIGTAKGLCQNRRSLETLGKTPPPRFITALANGRKVRSMSEIKYGSYVIVEMSCLTFPENDVTFQYRILPNGQWEMTRNSEISFPSLNNGSHTIEVRGKKNGPYAWSEIQRLQFDVAQPFWLNWWFVFGSIIAATLLILVTTFVANNRNKKQRMILQQLVALRTSELRTRNLELSDLNEEKNNLIGIVAHDLKSPLNQVAGLVSLLSISETLDEDSKSYVGMIDGSMTRLRDMITKILDVNAIESQSLNLSMGSVPFSDLAVEISSRFAHEAEAKNIRIICNIKENLFVRADKNYLDQVLVNLMSNAIKFSPSDRAIYVNLDVQGDTVLCEIKDEGPGLSVDDMKKLFGKYQRLSARPTGNESSTGLGLSIVKKFVDAMEGKIWCESVHKKGASFFVSFGQHSS